MDRPECSLEMAQVMAGVLAMVAQEEIGGFVIPAPFRQLIGACPKCGGLVYLGEYPVFCAPCRTVWHRSPAWVDCPRGCGNYLCNVHGCHVHDCPCPPREVWARSPYRGGA